MDTNSSLIIETIYLFMENKNKNQNQNAHINFLQTEELEDDIFDIDEGGLSQEWEKEITSKISPKEEEEKSEEGTVLTKDSQITDNQEETQQAEKSENLEEHSEEEEEKGKNDNILSSQKEYDKINISNNKLSAAKQLLKNIQTNSERLIELLEEELNSKDVSQPEERQEDIQQESRQQDEDSDKIVEGVFNGESMIGYDGQQYTVPMNYASKSKLVEGDVLKLTITGNGFFVYKQIQPIERQRMVGTLRETKENGYIVMTGDKSWKLLDAAVTYFKAESGDEIIFFIPKEGKSKWASVENIIKQ